VRPQALAGAEALQETQCGQRPPIDREPIAHEREQLMSDLNVDKRRWKLVATWHEKAPKRFEVRMDFNDDLEVLCLQAWELRDSNGKILGEVRRKEWPKRHIRGDVPVGFEWSIYLADGKGLAIGRDIDMALSGGTLERAKAAVEETLLDVWLQLSAAYAEITL
jgi:hypothetical protein